VIIHPLPAAGSFRCRPAPEVTIGGAIAVVRAEFDPTEVMESNLSRKLAL
jgi:hypothetical protein